MMNQNPHPNQTDSSTSQSLKQSNQIIDSAPQPVPATAQDLHPNQTNLSTLQPAQHSNQAIASTSQPVPATAQNSYPNQTNPLITQPTQTLPSNNTNNVDMGAKINRSIMFATWASAFISLIAMGTSIYTLVVSQVSSQEAFKLTSIRRFVDAPTQIREFANITGVNPEKRVTGIVSVYWKLFLSNNGSKDISIVKHNLLQIQGSNGLTKSMNYTGLDQGLYSIDESNKLVPLNLPVTISQGGTTVIYLKVGLLMDASVYELVKTEFQGKSFKSAKELESFLNKNNLDFYGNKVGTPAPGVFEYPSFNSIKEQAFGFSFETARGTKTSEVISLYKYSGSFNISE
jgi:hypothetical protein